MQRREPYEIWHPREGLKENITAESHDDILTIENTENIDDIFDLSGFSQEDLSNLTEWLNVTLQGNDDAESMMPRENLNAAPTAIAPAEPAALSRLDLASFGKTRLIIDVIIRLVPSRKHRTAIGGYCRKLLILSGDHLESTRQEAIDALRKQNWPFNLQESLKHYIGLYDEQTVRKLCIYYFYIYKKAILSKQKRALVSEEERANAMKDLSQQYSYLSNPISDQSSAQGLEYLSQDITQEMMQMTQERDESACGKTIEEASLIDDSTHSQHFSRLINKKISEITLDDVKTAVPNKEHRDRIGNQCRRRLSKNDVETKRIKFINNLRNEDIWPDNFEKLFKNYFDLYGVDNVKAVCLYYFYNYEKRFSSKRADELHIWNEIVPGAQETNQTQVGNVDSALPVISNNQSSFFGGLGVLSTPLQKRRKTLQSALVPAPAPIPQENVSLMGSPLSKFQSLQLNTNNAELKQLWAQVQSSLPRNGGT